MKRNRQKQKLYNMLMAAAIVIMVLAGVVLVQSLTGSSFGRSQKQGAGTTDTADGTGADSLTAEEEYADSASRGVQGSSQSHVEQLTGIAYVERSDIGFQLSDRMELRAGDCIDTMIDASLLVTDGKERIALSEETVFRLRESDTEADAATEKAACETADGAVAGADDKAAYSLESGEILAETSRVLSVAKADVLLIPEEQAVYALTVNTGTVELSVLGGAVYLAVPEEGTEKGRAAAAEEGIRIPEKSSITIPTTENQRDADSKDGNWMKNLQIESLEPDRLSNFAITYAKKAQGTLGVAASELEQILTDREESRKKELQALADHEAEIIANGLPAEGGSGEGAAGGNGTTGNGADRNGTGGAGSGNGSGSGSSSSQTKKVVTIAVYCNSVLSHMDKLTPGKNVYVPANGTILATCQVAYSEGETVFDILKRACGYTGVPLEYSYSGTYGSYYIEGINNLYEFDCGNLSGWTYTVNGWSPNYGCSSYKVKSGDAIVWNYVCN